MSFDGGMLHLTNWAGNVIIPTLAGLFGAAAIYRFGKAQPWQHLARNAKPVVLLECTARMFDRVESAEEIAQSVVALHEAERDYAAFGCPFIEPRPSL